MPCAQHSLPDLDRHETVEKYLFLDFDGPLHPTTAIQGRNVGLLASSPSALRAAGFFVWADRLEDLLAQAEATQPNLRVNVIVHSSWRAQAWFNPAVIRQSLGALGERVCGYTRMDLDRAQAVQELCERMAITDYAILDDDIQAFAGSPSIRQRLVAVNPLRGVSEEAVGSTLLDWAAAVGPAPTGSPAPSYG